MELHKEPEGEENKEAFQILRAQTQKNISATLERWNGSNSHLPGRPPGKPSPLRSLCGPVPAGSPAAAAAAGCPRCARLYNEVEKQTKKKDGNKEVRWTQITPGDSESNISQQVWKSEKIGG